MELKRNDTRGVRVGSCVLGDHNPIAVQSMTATHTQDIDATVAQVNALHEAGADVVRIAISSIIAQAGVNKLHRANRPFSKESPRSPRAGQIRIEFANRNRRYKPTNQRVHPLVCVFSRQYGRHLLPGVLARLGRVGQHWAAF